MWGSQGQVKHPKTTAVLGKAGHRNGGSVSSGPGLVAGPRAWLTGQSSVCPPACEPLSFGTMEEKKKKVESSQSVPTCLAWVGTAPVAGG